MLNLYILEDLMRIDELIDNDEHTGIVDKAALKVGCFLACIAQKKGIVRFCC